MLYPASCIFTAGCIVSSLQAHKLAQDVSLARHGEEVSYYSSYWYQVARFIVYIKYGGLRTLSKPYFPAMYVWQLWLEKVSYSDTDTWQPHAYSHLHFHVFISEGSLTFLSLAVIMG